MTSQEQLKTEILAKVAGYYRQVHAPVQTKPFVPAKPASTMPDADYLDACRIKCTGS